MLNPRPKVAVGEGGAAVFAMIQPPTKKFNAQLGRPPVSGSARAWSGLCGLLCAVWWLGAGATPLVGGLPKNPDFLIRAWLASDGIPENTAYSVAQTPDGYLWVATSEGLVRFNGDKFEAASILFDEPRLNKLISRLRVDELGRMWAGGDQGTYLHDERGWRLVAAPGAVALRTVAVTADHQTFFGSASGEVFQCDGDQLIPLTPPPGMMKSGVFCVRDAVDGGLWLANRGFIGRWQAGGWQRVEGETNLPAAVVAGAAHAGGLWVYGEGRLRHYRAGLPAQDVPAPKIEQPLHLLEDRQGRIWLTSKTSGLTIIATNGTIQRLTATNGLTHNSVWNVLEDREGGFWVGSGVGGLQHLRDRFFKTVGVEEGLPDRIVKTITADRAGNILVGTHGGSAAWIRQGTVEPLAADPRTRYVWSVLLDQAQRVWLGTYGNGLFLEEQGVPRYFPLAHALGETINALMEDSQKRIWVGTYSGAGIITGTNFQTLNHPILAHTTVRCFAEEPETGAIWIGTWDSGLFRLHGTNLWHLEMTNGLPGNRISSLTWDAHGGLWAGIFKHGLVFIQGDKISRVAAEQGLPALTLGSLLADDLGNFWLGSDRGILRVPQATLRRVAKGEQAQAKFEIFNEGDGLDNGECSEGYQPTAVRTADGQLWFATLNGVVTVNPRALKINPLPPPVMIEALRYRDRTGQQHTLPNPVGPCGLPPGSTELEVHCAALSFAALGKVQYAFQLQGENANWVNLGNQRVIYFHTLSPGSYQLRVKAANNDGCWNETGAELTLLVQPFFWQTWWFLTLFVLALLGLGGAVAWQFQRAKLLQQQTLLAQERLLIQEKARLASVLEGTPDFVAFTAPDGTMLYLNPAGRRLVGLVDEETITRFQLRDFFPAEPAQTLWQTAIPHAVRHGTWSGQTILQPFQNAPWPASQVIVAHRDAAHNLLFLSTIIRDVSERQQQEDELKKKNFELERFTYTVSHDLKSPLITIKGFATALLADLAAGHTHRAPTDLTRIVQATDKMTGLLNGLLELSRVGRILNPPQPVALQPLAEVVVELLAGSIQARRARVHISPQLPVVQGDVHRLQEVLQNLVENALKFAREEPAPEIEIGVVSGTLPPTIFVRDNGSGIEPRHHATIFGLFNQLNNHTGGHGIGLSLAQRIIEFHGGKIWVESAGLGHGATFYFTVPPPLPFPIPTSARATPDSHRP